MAKPKSHRRWTAAEYAVVKARRANGWSASRIGRALGRSLASVQAKIEAFEGSRKYRRACQECHTPFFPNAPNQKCCSQDCAHRREKRYQLGRNRVGEPRPVTRRIPKRFKPSMTFGICPKCGKERTCIHRCPLSADTQAAIKRGLFKLQLNTRYLFHSEEAA